MKVSLVTPSRPVFREREFDYVEFPSARGYMGVLPGHLPAIGLLSLGILSLKAGDKVEKYAVEEGFFEIEGDSITFLARVVHTPQELKREELERERDEAYQVLRSGTDPEEVEKAARTFTRASIFLTIAEG